MTSEESASRKSAIRQPDGPSVENRKSVIAVVTPFLDKRHGTERCLAEQVERLAEKNGKDVGEMVNQLVRKEVELMEKFS